MLKRTDMETKNIFEDSLKLRQGIIFSISVGEKIEDLYEGLINSKYPIFVLRSNDDKIRKYRDKKIEFILKPSLAGSATIFDKDVWIYSILQLKKFFNENEGISDSIVRFSPCKFFSATYRNSGGKNYHLLKKSLSRLKGTMIEISIFYNSIKKEIREVSFIDSWRILYRKKIKLYSEMIELKMPNWIARHVLSGKKIVCFNKEYFFIRKAVVRRLYEIVTLNSIKGKEYVVKLKDLYLNIGTTSLLKTFRYKIKRIELEGNIPGYYLRYDMKNELVYFTKNR